MHLQRGACTRRPEDAPESSPALPARRLRGVGAMTIYVTSAALAATLLLLASPIARRVIAFHLRAARLGLLRLAERAGARRAWARWSGRPHRALTPAAAARRFCEEMGPTFVKLGQVVASSSGIFPAGWAEEFQSCLDRVPPVPFAVVREVIDAELGEAAGRVVHVDPEPLASASIAQVHAGRLDDGTRVAIKVQRPGIASRIHSDVTILRGLARCAERFVPDAELTNPVGIVDDLAATLGEELDFRLEAANLVRFNRIMDELGRDDVVAPTPCEGLCTERVLVMERFDGTRIDDVEAIRARRLDAEQGLVDGLTVWLKCVFRYGFFHGDVHAGNLMLLDDDRLGFLDFGIVGRLDDRQRRRVTDYVVAFATGDYPALAEATVGLGCVDPEAVDMPAFATDLEGCYGALRSTALADVDYGAMLPRVQAVSREHRVSLPRELVLITKQLLYFDRYAKLLAPELNVFADPRMLGGLTADVLAVRAEPLALAS